MERDWIKKNLPEGIEIKDKIQDYSNGKIDAMKFLKQIKNMIGMPTVLYDEIRQKMGGKSDRKSKK